MHSRRDLNVYCDESTHLLRNVATEPYLVIGAVACPRDEVQLASEQIRDLKEQHGLSRRYEAKWTKVSPSTLDFTLALLNHFFADDSLTARVLLAPKADLRHRDFGHDHDTFYYKMYYQMLLPVVAGSHGAHVYLDIKDTRGADKVETLHEVLTRRFHDWDRRIVSRMQQVRSHEVELLQLADVILGGINYFARVRMGRADDLTSPAKHAVIEHLARTSRYPLYKNTPLHHRKLNLFYWKSKYGSPG